MKILHVIPSISKKRGGPSTAVLCMVRSLRDQGIDASILTTSDNATYQEGWPLGKWFWLDDIPLIIFPSLDSGFRPFREYLISPSLTRWLLHNIKEFDALHVHSIFSYSTTTAMMIARMKRVPYIVRTIGQLNTWSLTQSRLRKLIMLNLLERNNLNHSLAIHVTSKQEMNDIELICHHNNILCLELGVDCPPDSPAINHSLDQIVKFVFLSRIHPKKQLDVLLKALSKFQNNEYKNRWYLYVAGDGESDYVQRMKNLAQAYGINNSVEWMGHLDTDEKNILLRRVDWFILPSMSENFGLSAVEALAFGIPVIVSHQVGISEIVAQNKAGIVCGTDCDSIVDALSIALKGASEPMRYAAAKLAMDRFSWSSIGKKISDFYRQNLREGGRAC